MRILWQPQVPEQGPPTVPPIVLPAEEENNEKDKALLNGYEEWLGDCEDDD